MMSFPGDLDSLVDNPSIRQEGKQLASVIAATLRKNHASPIGGASALLTNLGGLLMEMNRGKRPLLTDPEMEQLSEAIRKTAERKGWSNGQVLDTLLILAMTLFQCEYFKAMVIDLEGEEV